MSSLLSGLSLAPLDLHISQEQRRKGTATSIFTNTIPTTACQKGFHWLTMNLQALNGDLQAELVPKALVPALAQ